MSDVSWKYAPSQCTLSCCQRNCYHCIQIIEQMTTMANVKTCFTEFSKAFLRWDSLPKNNSMAAVPDNSPRSRLDIIICNGLCNEAQCPFLTSFPWHRWKRSLGQGKMWRKSIRTYRKREPRCRENLTLDYVTIPNPGRDGHGSDVMRLQRPTLKSAS